MGKIILILLTALATALAVTNPSQETHKKTVYSTMATDAVTNQSVGQLAGTMLGNLDPLPYEYHNYLLFSTMTLRDETVSVGVLNRVWNKQ
jgi:hypothetical protein